ncbi:cubilin [Clonorchis sinensis]|uniref:Cubilin n=1 Tax=Clonorchis sinensis TaxID=79923 RepID=G7YTX9_CLOSI|nr:cubilin [Clonorchis sinensis]
MCIRTHAFMSNLRHQNMKRKSLYLSAQINKTSINIGGYLLTATAANSNESDLAAVTFAVLVDTNMQTEPSELGNSSRKENRYTEIGIEKGRYDYDETKIKTSQKNSFLIRDALRYTRTTHSKNKKRINWLSIKSTSTFALVLNHVPSHKGVYKESWKLCETEEVQSTSEHAFTTAALSVNRTATPKCGGKLPPNKGSFQTPGYPIVYPDDRNCTWTIDKPIKSSVLHFVDFEVEQALSGPLCQFDYVTVTIGSGSSATKVGPLCGYTAPEDILFNDSVKIAFISDRIQLFGQPWLLVDHFSALSAQCFEFHRFRCTSSCGKSLLSRFFDTCFKGTIIIRDAS